MASPSADAIVERFEPRAEKKFPSISISSAFKSWEIRTEMSPAIATNSQPERLSKKMQNYEYP